jgi:hypothetical protein
MSPQLRQLFVSIILFCEVADSVIFFLKWWRLMHDDTLHYLRSIYKMPNLRLSNAELQNYILYELELPFNAAATSFEKYNLPVLDGYLLSEVRNKLLREEFNYDVTELTS